MLAGVFTQAELLLLVFPLELCEVPEGEGEELNTGDRDEMDDGWRDDEWREDDGLGERGPLSYTTEELEVRVVEGRLPGTEVDWASGSGMGDEGRSTVLELEDPPLVMVKVGEVLPELPITKLNITLTN